MEGGRSSGPGSSHGDSVGQGGRLGERQRLRPGRSFRMAKRKCDLFWESRKRNLYDDSLTDTSVPKAAVAWERIMTTMLQSLLWTVQTKLCVRMFSDTNAWQLLGT